MWCDKSDYSEFGTCWRAWGGAKPAAISHFQLFSGFLAYQLTWNHPNWSFYRIYDTLWPNWDHMWCDKSNYAMMNGGTCPRVWGGTKPTVISHFQLFPGFLAYQLTWNHPNWSFITSPMVSDINNSFAIAIDITNFVQRRPISYTKHGYICWVLSSTLVQVTLEEFE